MPYIMNAMDTGCKSSTSYSRPYFETPLLAAPVRKTTYRRSSLTKAPRKRTFIANMSKINPMDGMTTAPGFGVVSMAAAAKDITQLCFDGGNDGNNGGSAPRLRFSGDDGSMPSSDRTAAPLALIVGAAVLVGTLLMAPGTANAGDSMDALFKVTTPSRGSLCLSAPAHTSVVPECGAIVYGRVELSRGERRMLSRRQQHFRETLRVERMGV